MKLLMLSGGGNRLAMTWAFLCRAKPQYDAIAGLSAGACAGALYEQGVEEVTIVQHLRRATPWNAYRKLRELLPVFITRLPEVPLYIQCSSLQGKRYIFQAQHCDSVEDYHALIIASVTQPLLAAPVSFSWRGEEYSDLIDGGTWDTLPWMAEEYLEHPVSQIFVVATSRRRHTKTKSNRLLQQLDLARLRNSKLEEDLDALETLGYHMDVITPATPLPPKWLWGKRVIDHLFYDGVELAENHKHASN